MGIGFFAWNVSMKNNLILKYFVSMNKMHITLRIPFQYCNIELFSPFKIVRNSICPAVFCSHVFSQIRFASKCFKNLTFVQFSCTFQAIKNATTRTSDRDLKRLNAWWRFITFCIAQVWWIALIFSINQNQCFSTLTLLFVGFFWVSISQITKIIQPTPKQNGLTVIHRKPSLNRTECDFTNTVLWCESWISFIFAQKCCQRKCYWW